MIDRLDIGRALGRPLASLSPVDNRRLGEAGFREVVREQLWLRLRRFGEQFLQRLGNSPVLDLSNSP